jgi:hypothetical protein
VRHHQTKRDVTGHKLASTQTQFMSTFVEWRNSRLESFLANRKVDRWHEAMVNDKNWHRWFLAGTVESETIISRSAVAHIYDNVRAKTAGTSQLVGSAKRGPLGLHRTRSARIQIRYPIFCEFIRFPPGSCAVGGRQDNSEDSQETSRCLQPDQCSCGPPVPDAASAVPAILAEGSLPSAAEAAAVAVLAEFRRNAEETRRHARAARIESRRRRGELPALCRYRYFSLRFDGLGCSSACADFSPSRLPRHARLRVSRAAALRQPHIQGPALSAGGTPAACAAAESALPPVHPARSPPPRSASVPPPPHAARRGDLEGKECLPIGLRQSPYVNSMDCARTVLAGPYRSPVAPRSALPGITRTMASGSMQASSR